MLQVLLCTALLCSVASADTLRMTVRPSSGEIIGWPRNKCGTDIADNVRRIVFKRPYVEVVDGVMSARVDEKLPVRAHRQLLGEAEFVAFYDPTPDRSIVFTVRHRKATGRTVPVEISIIVRDPHDRSIACRETWLGLGERI
jgi:hypothetical protein